MLGERHRQALVEQPAERAADAAERLRRNGAGGTQCVGVDVLTLPEADRDEARRVEVAVRVQEQRFAEIASQLAALGKLRKPAAELLVDDAGAFAAERLRDRNGQRVDLRLPRKGDLDGYRHGAGDSI